MSSESFEKIRTMASQMVIEAHTTDPYAFAFGVLTTSIKRNMYPNPDDLKALAEGLQSGIIKWSARCTAMAAFRLHQQHITTGNEIKPEPEPEPAKKPLPGYDTATPHRCVFTVSGEKYRCSFWAVTPGVMLDHDKKVHKVEITQEGLDAIQVKVDSGQIKPLWNQVLNFGNQQVIVNLGADGEPLHKIVQKGETITAVELTIPGEEDE